jgi:1,4-dihydroxy-2-naphthoate octaprenyltransferase
MNNETINPIQRWWLAIRPKTLTAAISPVIVGWGISAAGQNFHWGGALAALFGAILIQIGTNLVNDVVDFAKGTDNEERLGPTRVTQAGLLSIKQVWGGVVVSFGLAILAGVYLITLAGWPIVIIGVSSILAGILYTAGPYPLAYIGLGDLFVMIFFGFVAVCGTVLVVAGEILPLAWWLAAPVGALSVNILVVNNIRDLDTDRTAGRKNIPVLFGRQAAETEYILMNLLAYGIPLYLMLNTTVTPFALLIFISLPSATKLTRKLRSGLSGAPLNLVLGQTAQLLFHYCLLLSIGLFAGAYI